MGKKGAKADAVSEYQRFLKMGLISLEEVDAAEAQEIMQTAPTSGQPKSRKERNKERRRLKRGVGDADADDPTRSPEEAACDEDFLTALPGWKPFFETLHPTLLRGLALAGFAQPTPIQSQVLSALRKPEGGKRGRDVLGCAPTGSGKTLAYLLPILNDLLQRPPSSPHLRTLFALVVVPTRELALQIEKHFKQLVQTSGAVRAVTLVGGLSQEKQERLLSYSPPILIGTPGRLAETIAASEPLQTQLGSSLEYLVLDEADRLAETGHFKDLHTILDLISAAGKTNKESSRRRKTFLFSATLGKSVNALRRRIRFNDPHPITINAASKASEEAASTPAAANPTTLKHYRLTCLEEEKLMHLAALLHQARTSAAEGRALVFVNSIALVKDLAQSLVLLGFAAGSLHAQMVQKQRLKSLERFASLPHAVLVTSDVAARGLDISAVSLVVHYHVPRTLDTFLHRSGRTARANRVGSSVAIVSPAESTLFGRLASQGQMSLHEAVPDLLSLGLVESYRRAAVLAQQIAKAESQQNRQAREKSWEEKAAEALGVNLDEAPRSKRRMDDDDDHPQAVKRAKQSHLASLKAQLSQLLPAAPTAM